MKIASELKGGRTVAAMATLVIVGGGMIWLSRPGAGASARKGMVYTAAGFGGFIPAPPVVHKAAPAKPINHGSPAPGHRETKPAADVDLGAGVLQAAEAYQAGRYAD